MSVLIRAEFAAHAWWGAKRPSLAAVLLSAALLSACSATPPAPLSGPHPANPAARAPQGAYRSTVAPYESLRPVAPGSWREQNERVSPAPRS